MPRQLLIILLSLSMLNSSCKSQSNNNNSNLCSPSSCGKIRNISYPFRLRTDPRNCTGQTWHHLSCHNDVTTITLNSITYNVESINYATRALRISDPNVRKDVCSSLPRHSVARYNFTSSPFRHNGEITGFTYSFLAKTVIFMSCESPVASPRFIDAAASCANNSRPGHYFYAMVDDGNATLFDIPSSCRIEVTTMAPSLGDVNVTSFDDIHNALVYGVELLWFLDQLRFGDEDIWDKIIDYLGDPYTRRALGIFLLILLGLLLLARFTFGSPFVLILLIYKWRRRHLSMYDRIEEFLQSYNNLMPIRYSYSEIKKMSKGFKDKLGEGGYGSVYRGKLRSDRFVAIKMLGDSKGNGEDFINEVATIGRIHHVNVVQLVGFCVEGSKRALVYDYMPKGSLDKHIFSNEGVKYLSSKKMFEISLGIARGIEYLHRGCEIQILHFDIKPHNILLDENFVPKVSDFGLARLCSSENNTVTLTAARGTLGYIAPELFYKNIGGVSYKADVYSFGMLLMEMASRRKNVSSEAENSSRVHFPTWVSNQFTEGKDVNAGIATDEESNLISKMMIVALWCIQFKPSDRPSMSKVVEMLEEERETLQMPPTKFSFYPQEQLSEDPGDEESSWSYSSSIESGDYCTTHNSASCQA